MDSEALRNEHLDYYILHRDEFTGEAGHTKLLHYINKYKPTLHKKTLGFDVGANVGNALHELDSLCNEQGRKLLAFEPNPLNLPLLHEAARNFQTVEIHPVAVSDTEGMMSFYTFKKNENKPGYTLGGLRAGGKEITKVIVRTLDSVLKDYPDDEYDIKYVKIDTEGNDTLVLRGLQQNLHRVHYILFEASDCLKDFRGPGEASPLGNCVSMLDKAGFDVYRIGTERTIKISGSLWHPAYDSLLMWSNCFALKKQDTILKNFLTAEGYYLDSRKLNQ